MNFALLMKAQVAIMVALMDAVKADGKDLTEEDQAKYDAAETEFNRLRALKEKEDKLAAMVAAIPAPEPVKVVKPAANSDSAANGINAGDDLKNKKPYANIGEMMIDSYQHKVNGSEDSRERLQNATGVSTQTGEDGGHLVPAEFIGDKMELAVYDAQLAPRCMDIKTSKNTVQVPKVTEASRADGQRYGGISTSWINEGGTITPSKPSFRLADIKLSKLGSMVVATEEMLEDAVFLASWFDKMFVSDQAFELDNAIYEGDGNGKPLGVIKGAGLISVAKEDSQTADTVVYENVIKMWSRMKPSSFARSVWYVSPTVLPQLPLMNLTVGTGGAPVFLPPGGASVSPYGNLLGRPLVPIEQATKVGDLGDIVLADMSDYMLISKGGIKSAESIHVYFNTDEKCWRFIKRVNGMPYTDVAVASRADSSFTTSPYVGLAARA